MERPLVSVVVLNWNGKRFIDPFMKSFLEQTYPPDRLELLFTDNASSDDSVAYFEEHYASKYEHCRVVVNDGNYGYAGGNNLGLKQIRGDYALICNNDLELDKGAIAELVSVAEAHDSSVTAAKLLYLNKPGFVNNAGSVLLPNNPWPIKEIGINEKDSAEFSKDYEISSFCGACILVRRDFLETVGLFDARFFMYFEDGDLAWRGQRAGKTFYFAGKAIAHHVHTGSSKEGSPLFNHFVGRNRLLILTKNARFGVIVRGWVSTLRDHLLLRTKRLFLAVAGKYPKRLALREFWLSQKMLWAALLLTPYALLKRYKVIKEATL